MNRHEPAAVQERYARRDATQDARRYSLFLDAAAQQAQQERLRAMATIWRAHGWTTLADKALLEVGCGAGGNLQDLLRLGASAQSLTGLELLPERAAAARSALPALVRIEEGDALAAAIAPASQHAVLAFTVFSSLLDAGFRQQLAEAMWRWVAPGGGVLVYDFAFDNPNNADVLGMSARRIRALFPQASCRVKHLTLAPPIARRLPAPLLAPASVVLWPLRTHRLVWAVKPA
ncbi:class I SAM-dependent methyltransferase [Rivibacter subsaxonicus]|uniref:Methyltransferase family protein n=1 Tax=Rivibacter subsaxonicus TaxID=457575 RepID=A0A4Q7VGQ7_9BURK|nr:class I SAM-dependent methyltransferase [Rivibacter subsaxonicus]RZT95232.1 methyltransferase family protein [Rivibacter subsaxonicus]